MLELSLQELSNHLIYIQAHDPSSKETFNPIVEMDSEQRYYDYRNTLIMQAVVIAHAQGFKAGYKVHTPITDIIEKGWDESWGVVAYIELPTGQVSWHLESPDVEYDGHNYTDKLNRISDFVGQW